MSFEQYFATLLRDPRITALVSDRAWPSRATQDAQLPYIVWQRVASAPQVTHDPVADLEQITSQVTCLASTYEHAVNIRRMLRHVIEGNTTDHQATYNNPQDIQSDSTGIYATSADFDIWFNDTDDTDTTQSP